MQSKLQGTAYQLQFLDCPGFDLAAKFANQETKDGIIIIITFVVTQMTVNIIAR